MELIYRLADVAELEEILAVQSLSLRMLLRPSMDEDLLEALIEDQAKRRSLQQELILVAVGNGQILGFVACFVRLAQITGLYVHPDFVRQGIGSSLLVGIAQMFNARKYRSITVYSSEYAIPFYEYHGFQIVRESQLILSRHERVTTALMRKTIRQITPEEEQRNKVVFGILIVLIIVSLWATFSS